MSSRAGLTANPHYPQARRHGEGDSSGPRRLVADLQARRADERLRKAACRDAMVDWL